MMMSQKLDSNLLVRDARALTVKCKVGVAGEMDAVLEGSMLFEWFEANKSWLWQVSPVMSASTPVCQG